MSSDNKEDVYSFCSICTTIEDSHQCWTRWQSIISYYELQSMCLWTVSVAKNVHLGSFGGETDELEVNPLD